MDMVTVEALMKFWGINMVVVGVVAALCFATTAMLKKHYNLKEAQNLYASVLAAGVWSVGLLLPMGTKPTTIIITAVLGFISASGGWQGFKDALSKAGEKLAGFNKPPSQLTDVKPGE